MPRAHVTELRVRYAETDRMGVVYHANYLAWCEVGRTEFVRQAGMSYRDMEEAGVGLAVIDATLRFHAAATYDDVVRIETRLAEVRSRTVTFEYVISDATSGRRLVSASTRLASVDPAGTTIVMPTGVRALLSNAVAERDDGSEGTP